MRVGGWEGWWVFHGRGKSEVVAAISFSMTVILMIC